MSVRKKVNLDVVGVHGCGECPCLFLMRSHYGGKLLRLWEKSESMCTSENVVVRALTRKTEDSGSDINIQNPFWGFIQVNKQLNNRKQVCPPFQKVSSLQRKTDPCSLSWLMKLAFLPLQVLEQCPCPSLADLQSALLEFRYSQTCCTVALVALVSSESVSAITVQRRTSFVSCMFESKLLRFLGKANSWMLSSN